MDYQEYLRICHTKRQLLKSNIDVSLLSPKELEDILLSFRDESVDELPKLKTLWDLTENISKDFWLDNIIDCPLNENIEMTKAKKFLSNPILIIAGSGMSSDSNIPTFQGRGILDYDIYKNSLPDVNYHKLRSLSEDSFVLTSNVDKLFSKSNFKNIFEIHGNVSDYFCSKCQKVSGNICCKESIPFLIKLGHKYQNVYDSYLSEKENELKKWIDSKEKITILEIGCGIHIPVLRDYSEILLEKEKFSLIRVNPDHCCISDNLRDKTSLVKMKISEFLKKI